MMRTSSPAAKKRDGQSAWAPLANPIFRALWIAAMVSNIGTWMQDVGAGWLMTSLSASPLMVALVQAAMSFSIMLLALPAGAIADIVDRRHLLMLTQSWMLLAAAVLGALTVSGMTTAPLLLSLTLALGLGSAFTLPAWSAMIPELVRRKDLQAAITLTGASQPVVTHYLAITVPGERREGGSA